MDYPAIGFKYIDMMKVNEIVSGGKGRNRSKHVLAWNVESDSSYPHES